MINAYIFDLDGTLINSLNDLADACNYALRQLGYKEHPVEAYKYFVGDGVLNLMKRIIPQEYSTEENIQKLLKIEMDYYAEHCFDKTKLYDDILYLLKRLKKRNKKIAVVSNKPDVQTQFMVSKFFNEGTFDIITGKLDGYLPKPDPLLTKKIIERLGEKPSDCAFIGDSGMDILTAVNCGCVPIGVTWGFRDEKELLENGAEFIVSRPLEILEI